MTLETRTYNSFMSDIKAVEPVTVPESQTLVAGTVLGKINNSIAAPVGAADGGNIGDATIGSITVGTKAKVGVYNVNFLMADGVNIGLFEVLDPDNKKIGIASVGVAFTSEHVNFTISAGAAASADGDTFTVTVLTNADAGKYIKAVKAATDGSSQPVGVLTEDVTTAVSEEKEATLLIAGNVASNKLTFGTGWTAANTKEDFRKLGIFYTNS